MTVTKYKDPVEIINSIIHLKQNLKKIKTIVTYVLNNTDQILQNS